MTSFVNEGRQHCKSFLRDSVKNHTSNNFCNGRYYRTVNCTSCCSTILCLGWLLYKIQNRIMDCKTSNVLLLEPSSYLQLPAAFFTTSNRIFSEVTKLKKMKEKIWQQQDLNTGPLVTVFYYTNGPSRH